MTKCYSCGSTAQIKLESTHTDNGIMETVTCGCGCVTKMFYEKKFVESRLYYNNSTHGTLIYKEGER